MLARIGRGKDSPEVSATGGQNTGASEAGKPTGQGVEPQAAESVSAGRTAQVRRREGDRKLRDGDTH